MLSYQYRKFHCRDKTILWLSYLHNGISYTGKTASLYWIATLKTIAHWLKPNMTHFRADSRFAPSQWEMALLCNGVSHWLGASLESALHLWHELATEHSYIYKYIYISMLCYQPQQLAALIDRAARHLLQNISSQLESHMAEAYKYTTQTNIRQFYNIHLQLAETSLPALSRTFIPSTRVGVLDNKHIAW